MKKFKIILASLSLALCVNFAFAMDKKPQEEQKKIVDKRIEYYENLKKQEEQKEIADKKTQYYENLKKQKEQNNKINNPFEDYIYDYSNIVMKNTMKNNFPKLYKINENSKKDSYDKFVNDVAKFLIKRKEIAKKRVEYYENLKKDPYYYEEKQKETIENQIKELKEKIINLRKEIDITKNIISEKNAELPLLMVNFYHERKKYNNMNGTTVYDSELNMFLNEEFIKEHIKILSRGIQKLKEKIVKISNESNEYHNQIEKSNLYFPINNSNEKIKNMSEMQEELKKTLELRKKQLEKIKNDTNGQLEKVYESEEKYINTDSFINKRKLELKKLKIEKSKKLDELKKLKELKKFLNNKKK